MRLFGRAGRKAGRVAKNVAKNMIMPQDDAADSKKKASKSKASAEAPKHTDEEYEALKEKYEAVMRSKWEEYYKTSCDGECETCEYYDWCPDDFVDEDDQDKEAQLTNDDTQDAEPLEQESEEDSTEEPAEDAEEESSEDEVELTEEELAAKEAAEAYYEAGCDGECETCEHYDWCPAEVEGDADDEVLFKGITQGDVKNVAKEGAHLAREGALAAKELKEAMDDIFGGLDLKSLTK